MASNHSSENCPPSKPDKHAIHVEAAMMEELGTKRKDHLPLEDKRGWASCVNLEALERVRRANDPRTAEHKIFQENEMSISAWNSTKFHDVDEADLTLDEMNLGQSHRLRMTAELGGSLRGTSTSTRGGHMQSVGRGGSSIRGRDNLNISRTPDPSASRGEKRYQQTLSRLRGMSVEPKSASGKNTPASALAHYSSTLSVLQPKTNLSYRDKQSVFGQRVSPNNRATSEAARGGKLQKLEVSQSDQPAGNFCALVTPEEFLKKNWVLASKMAGDGGKETKSSESTTSKSIVSNNIAESSIIDHFDQLEASPLQTAVGLPAESGSEILQQAGVKLEITIRNLEHISLDKGNAQLVRITDNEQKQVIIMFEADRTLTFQCHASSIFNFTEESCSIGFETVEAGIYKKWRLTFLLPSDAAQFRDELLQHIPNPASVGDSEALITFSDEPEAQAEVYSEFTEDLLSLIDTSRNEMLDDTKMLDDTNCEESSCTSLSLLQRYGGLAASTFATATEKSVPKHRATFNALHESVSKDYTNNISSRPLHLAQDPTSVNPQDPLSSSEGQSESNMNATNNDPQGFTNTRITYSIEELKNIKPNACIIEENLLQNIDPRKSASLAMGAAKTTHTSNNINTGAKTKKPRGLADSIYADKKQTIPSSKIFNSKEKAFPSSPTSNFKNGTTITSIDKNSRPLKDGDSLSLDTDMGQVTNPTLASGKPFHLKGGLSSIYATSPNVGSSSLESLETRKFTKEVSSTESESKLLPSCVSVPKKKSEVEPTTAKLDQHTPHRTKLMTTVDVTPTSGNDSAPATPLNTSGAKQKSPLNPVCKDFTPSKISSGDKGGAVPDNHLSLSHDALLSRTNSNDNSVAASPRLGIRSDNPSVIDTSVRVLPRYETFLLPDPLMPGYYQEVRGFLKTSIQGQFVSGDPNLGIHHLALSMSPVPTSSGPLTLPAELPTPPSLASKK